MRVDYKANKTKLFLLNESIFDLIAIRVVL